ncbi:MAG: tripartite tricarboxylate transporter substrate binding protein [Betaproteobacteria bacterium]|nr:tripartite tricarboxylate transporter substrate binding protein [Betaproteobacteria bacterium]
MARLLGVKMSEGWSQSVVVDNRAGAGGTIGTRIVAEATPDGHTILMGNLATHGINPTLYRKLPYDAIKDFTAITYVASVTNVLVVHPSLRVGTVKELIALARAKPGTINYGSGGSGSGAHLAAELFNFAAAVRLTHVPYKGVGLAMNDLVGGQIQLMFSNLLSSLPHMNSARLKALAVTTGKRSPAVPDLPTIAEAGVPGYETTNWFGVFAPAGMSKGVTTKLNRSIVKILHAPEMKSRLTAQGADPIGSTPEAFAAHVRSEISRWKSVIKRVGIRAD